jgi:hypothetical protein
VRWVLPYINPRNKGKNFGKFIMKRIGDNIDGKYFPFENKKYH